MKNGPQTTALADDDSPLQKAIATFELILSGTPDDQASLEALTHIYEQIGSEEELKHYLLRLAEVLLSQRDVDAIEQIIDKVRDYAIDDEKARRILVRLEALKE